MRSYLPLVVSLVLISGVEVVRATPVARFELRQDDGETLGPLPAPTTTAAGGIPEFSIEPSSASTSQEGAPETTEAADDIPTSTSSPTLYPGSTIAISPTEASSTAPANEGTPGIDAGEFSVLVVLYVC